MQVRDGEPRWEDDAVFSGEPYRDLRMGTGALVSFPGVSLPAPLAVSRHRGTGWGVGGAESICVSGASSHAQERKLEVDFGEGD